MRQRTCEELSLYVVVWFLILGGPASVAWCEWTVWEFVFSSVLGFTVVILFSTNIALLARSYWLATHVESYAPLDWVPPEATEQELAEAREAGSQAPTKLPRPVRAEAARRKVRYCGKCRAFKPPRAHHCRECDRCVLRMDHHCPWVGNCVAYYNQKCFVLFLVYSQVSLAVACAHHAAGLFHCLGSMEPDKFESSGYSIAKFIVMILSLCLMLPFLLGLTPLTVSQISGCMHNETTLEEYAREREGVGKHEGENPYNLGVVQNLREVFGPSVWEWPLPTVPARTPIAGILYPKRLAPASALV
eukprot:m51a1_g9826 hypothetical protein (303) ;mRNA; f:1913407-1914905